MERSESIYNPLDINSGIQELNSGLLQSITRIIRFQAKTSQEFLDHALTEIIVLSRSKIGYIFHHNKSRKEFVLNSCSKEFMKEFDITRSNAHRTPDEIGIWGEAVRQRKTVIMNDFSGLDQSKQDHSIAQTSLKKFMTIPVFDGEEIVGVVGVANKETDYSPNDVMQLQSLLEPVWKMLEHKQTLEREEHLKNVLLGVRNMNQLIIQENEPGELIQKACENLTNTVGYFTAWIALIDQNKNVPLTASAGRDSSKADFTKYLKSGIIPECMTTALDCNGVIDMSDRLEACSTCPFYKHYGIRTGLSTAISYGETTYGVLTVTIPSEFSKLTESHELLLEVAEDIGFALNKIELANAKKKSESELVERVKELSCLSAISLALQSGFDEKEVIGSILRHLIYAMQFPEVAVLAIDIWQRNYTTHETDITYAHGLHSNIIVKDIVAGKLSVYYTDPGKPLLAEEQQLIDHVAMLLGIWLERQEAMQGQKEHAENLRITLNSIGDAVISTDIDGNVANMNPVAEMLTGWILQEAKGKPATEIFNIENVTTQEKAENPIFQVLKTGETVGLANHTKLISKNGLEYQIADSAAPIRDVHGNTTGVVVIFRDVTQAYQMRERLKENEKKYRTLIETSLDAVFINQDNCITYVNPAALKLLGAETPEQILGKSPFEIFHPDFHETIHHRIREMLEEEKPVAYIEEKIVRLDGHTVDVEVGASPFHIDGKPAIQVVLRDITEKKAAGLALRENEALIRAIIDNLPVGVAVNSVDPTVNFSYMNSNFAKIYRTTPEALLKPDAFWEAVYEDAEFRKKIKQQLLEDVASGDPERLHWEDIPITRKGQGTTYINARNNPVPAKPLMVSTVWDVTDRKTTEDKLRSGDRIFNHALDMLCIAGFDGYFKVLNPSWSRVLGWSQEEMLAKPWIDFVHPDDIDATKNIGSTIVNGKEVYQFENRYICKDGSVKWLSWNSYPENEDEIMYGVARDVTDYKTMEKELKEREEMFRLIASNSIDAIWQMDLKLRFTYMSPSCYGMTGYTQEEMVGKPLYKFATWKAFAKMGRAAISTIANFPQQSKVLIESTLLKKNGEELPVEIIGKLLTDEKGKLIGLQGSTRDISGRKIAELKLRQLSRAVEQSPASIVITDLHGSIEYVNPKFTDITGYTAQEALGNNPRILKSGLASKEMYHDLWKTITSGNTWRGEFHNRKKNGKLYWEMASISPILNEKGEVTHFIGIKEDITERKRQEEKLKQNEEKHRSLIEQMLEGLLVVSVEGWIQFANPAFCNILGYDESELIGKNAHKILLNDESRKFIIEKEQNRRKGISEQYELNMHTKSGEEVFLLMSSTPVKNAKGEVIGSMSTCIDITERKKVVDVLKNREQFLQKIFDILPIGLWFADEKGTLLKGNAAGVKIWGGEPRVGIKDYGVFKARRLPSREEIKPSEWALAKAVAEGITTEEELLEIDTFDGRKKIILNYAAPILIDGNVQGAIVLNRDITERFKYDLIQKIQYNMAQAMVVSKNLSELYAITREELSVLFDTSNFFIAFYDDKTGLLSSPFDMTEDDHIQNWPAEKSLTGIVIKKGKALLLTKEEIGQMVRDGIINLIGQRSEIWMGVPIKTSKQVIGAIVVQSFTDPGAYDKSSLKVLESIANQLSVYIEHKRAQENLSNSEEMFTLIAENTADNITVMDLDLNITYTSPSVFLMRGYTQEEVITQKIDEILTPESLPIIVDVFNHEMQLESQGTADPKRTLKLELQEYHKDGSVVWLENSMSFLRDHQQKAIGIVAISRDITLRKKTEQALREAKDKAEASDVLKTAFMNNISHEIRTPLNGILGFGQIIAYSNLTESERLKYLEILQQSTDRLIHTITDYMDISLIVSGNLEINKDTFDLHEFMEQMLSRTQARCREKSIDIQLEQARNDVAITINSDRELLQKVMEHLLNNAIKFTPQGQVSFGYHKQDNGLAFFIKDTGIGISSEAMETIFEAFQQEDFGMTRAYEGSGLGLSISKGIINKLGGKIWLESEKEKGTTVHFHLPEAHTSTTPDTRLPEHEEIKLPDHPLILVAEDDESNYLYLEVVLQKMGFKVMHAANGKIAVEKCRQHAEINLVLMDIKMPVMNGLEATTLIKEFRSNLPVIAITAYALSGDEYRIKQAGCDDYLAKPVRKDLLMNIVEKHLYQKKS
ncbi:MAG: PAS domain S-box protein [Bacteroidales bacterium]|nr:PAS domain S-box protein [Bacteroidales bacterium]